MDKAAKMFLNSLKCPVCGAQIDLFSWVITRVGSKKGHNFGCAAEPSHYGIYFMHWEVPHRLELESALVTNNGHQYEVRQTHYLGGKPVNFTEIRIWDIDAENRVINSSVFKSFNFDKHLFDFSKTNKEKLVNRIKTILVFQ